MIITIDGPTASGKSTVGRLVAQELGAYYLYSGLLFRALAYNYNKFGDLAQLVNSGRLEYRYAGDKQHGSQDNNIAIVMREQILFEGRDITHFLKTKDIDDAASRIATRADVRLLVHTWQHYIAQEKSVVVDGRDAGSVVFPHADYKFFITASVPERAWRWVADQKKQGAVFSLEQATAILAARDGRDMNRELAPLTIPRDACVIDNTMITIQDTLQAIVQVVLKNSKQVGCVGGQAARE
jgi:cytidylate kinase